MSIFKHCDEFQYRDVSCDKSQRFICEYKEDNNSTIIDDLATIKNRTDDLTLELDSNKDDSNIDPKIDSYEAGTIIIAPIVLNSGFKFYLLM